MWVIFCSYFQYPILEEENKQLLKLYLIFVYFYWDIIDNTIV